VNFFSEHSYTRKQVAKRHTQRSYGLDRYVTCR